MSKIFKLYGSLLLILILLNFCLPRLMPGGPLEYLEGQESGATLTEQQKNSMIEYYGLNDSIVQQFLDYLVGIIQLDFGFSYTYKLPVTDIIVDHISYTLWIVGISSFLSILIGIILGLLSGWVHHRKGDQSIMSTMLAIGALPEFLFGMLLLIVFGVMLNILPMSGAHTPFLENESGWAKLIDVAEHAILPIVTLTTVNLTRIYFLVRNETIQVASSPYIEFARMKGVREFRLIYRHTFKNVMIPIFTLIMIRIGFTFTGAIFVETLFSYPGIGQLLKESILSRDYPLMHGLFLLFALMILLCNALADLLYPKLDPRVKGGEYVEKNV